MRRRLERQFLVAGWVVIALLGAVLVRSWLHYRDARPPRAASMPVASAAAAPPAHAPTTAPAPLLPPPPVFALRAARGDCWIAVRAGSAAGRVLYEGVLPTRKSVRFRARRLWVRLGAPLNLDATLGGRAVGLPTGVSDVVVTPTGVHRAAR